MYKLIITDMDGTLLDHTHTLPEGFMELLHALHARGIHFCAASGRQYFNLLEYFRPLQNEIFYIAENGALVMHGETFESAEIIPKSTVSAILQLADDLGVRVVLAGVHGAFIAQPTPDFEAEVRQYYARLEIVDNLYAVTDDIIKIAICDPKGAESSVYTPFKEKFSDFQVTLSAAIWVDIMKSGVNKGEALKTLAAHLGIDCSEIVAFGDYLNDVEMLKVSGRSYAMAKAHPAVKAVADAVIGCHADGAVAAKIRELFF